MCFLEKKIWREGDKSGLQNLGDRNNFVKEEKLISETEQKYQAGESETSKMEKITD